MVETRRRDLNLKEVSDSGAPEDVSKVYQRIRETLRANVVNYVWRVFATKPRFLEAVWDQLEPAVDEGFLEAAEGIRSMAIERVWEGQTVPDHRKLLDGNLHDAVQRLRVFLEVNPRIVILTSALRLSWQNGQVGGAREPVSAERGVPDWHPDIETKDPAMGDLKKVYKELVEILDLPSPNTDYKMLGVWPEYFTSAWNDLKTFVATDSWKSEVKTVEWVAKQAAVALPATITVSPGRAKDLGLEDDEVEEVGTWIEAFDAMLPGLIVNTSYLWVAMNGGRIAVPGEGHPLFEKAAS